MKYFYSVVCLLAVIIVILGVFLQIKTTKIQNTSKSGSISQETSNSNTLDTSSWSVYHDEASGFTIKYPRTFQPLFSIIKHILIKS